MKRVQTYRLAMVRDRAVTLAEDTVMNGAAARRIAQSMIGDSPVERFVVICLAMNGRVLAAVEIATSGGAGHVDIARGAVAKVALLANARAVVLAHNHPSGDPTPSGDDVVTTRQIRAELDVLGIVLHEHFVITLDGASREVDA